MWFSEHNKSVLLHKNGQLLFAVRQSPFWNTLLLSISSIRICPLCVKLKIDCGFSWHEDCVDGISSPSLDMSNSVVMEISFCGPHCYRSVVAFAMAFRKYYTRNSLSTDITSLIELRRISAIFVHECQFSYFVVCVSCDKMRCICILCFRNQKFQASAPSSIEYDYEYH